MKTDYLSSIELFCSRDYTAHGTVDVDGHRENWPIDSPEFERWLVAAHYKETAEVLGDKKLKEIRTLLQGLAQVNGPTVDTSVRVATQDGKVYLDSGDRNWSTIEISTSGYKLIPQPPEQVKFVRAPGVLPYPKPEPNGSIDELRDFIPIADDSAWRLTIACMIASLNPIGPYPNLIFNGEAGSAKSTACKFYRDLVDPSVAPLRGMPRSEQDLFISAQNCWLQVTDNISYLSDTLSDAWCRLATGGSFVTRRLYTNSRQHLVHVCRPSIFNGIQEFCLRSDFGDRSIFVTLPRIPDTKRKRLHEVEQRFQEARPRIFGALLEALSATLRELPNINAEKLPRMADFGLFALAVERALEWPSGSIMSDFDAMRYQSNEAILESCGFAPVIEKLAKENWTGSATELLEKLENAAPIFGWEKHKLPKDPARMSGTIRRLAPAFRTRHIEINCDGQTSGSGSKRFIQIRFIKNAEKYVSDPMLDAKMRIRENGRANRHANT